MSLLMRGRVNHLSGPGLIYLIAYFAIVARRRSANNLGLCTPVQSWF